MPTAIRIRHSRWFTQNQRRQQLWDHHAKSMKKSKNLPSSQRALAGLVVHELLSRPDGLTQGLLRTYCQLSSEQPLEELLPKLVKCRVVRLEGETYRLVIPRHLANLRQAA